MIILIPKGKLSVSEEEAARRRRELRERLLRGETVTVTPHGVVQPPGEGNRSEPRITVPEGKLASFYWYENYPPLLRDEKEAMKRFFPQFKLDKLDDGRMSWHGKLNTDLRSGGVWYLQAIYDNNHPHNNSYGGSIKVYSVEPDLDKMYDELGGIPHVLRDSKGYLYICTARMEDVKAGNVVTSAASSIAWAAKWISAFELWLAGDLSSEQFRGHSI